MKIIKPENNFISIINLIREAKKSVIIVSPYSDIAEWDMFKDVIYSRSTKGIDISFYVRKGGGAAGLEKLDITIYEVPNLHAKIFFNDKQVIISSFHLKYNADINWAFINENQTEYNEFHDFFYQYIKPLAEIY